MTRRARLERAFRRAAGQGRAALIPFLAAGDPDFATTVALARAAADGGADVLELGVPFSDSLADGPVIQAAYGRALAGGARVRGVLTCAAHTVQATGLPVVLMSALNPLLSYGIHAFCRDAAAGGMSGVLVSDLPVEDSGELRAACEETGLAAVFLAAPDSGKDRVAAAARASTGFLYLVRRRGVTGARGDGEASQALEWARRTASVPVALGFGIASDEEASEAARAADGVVVGSALVRAAAEAYANEGRSEAPHDSGTRRAAREAAAAVVRARVADLAAALRAAGRVPTDPGARR